MKGLLLLASLALLAVLVHVTLYGWRQAPVNVVRLTRRQWAILAGFALPPLIAGTLIFAFRRSIWARFGAGAGGIAEIWCIGALLAIVLGVAPHHRDPDDSLGMESGEHRRHET